MLDLLLWLIAIEAIGFATLPLCYYLFPRLADRGYSVAKPLGLLILGYTSWLLSVLHILPSTQLTVAALLLAGGVASWRLIWPRRGELLEFAKRHRKTLVASEAVFLVVFIVWAFYRSYDPAIDHTEQPMDFAFLNAAIRSFTGFPEDPWLSGSSVSYYYFGYWMMGTLSKLTGIQPSVSYNLALALVPAMATMGIFGLVFGLVRADGGRLRQAVMAGVASAVLLAFVSNLEGVLEFMRANGMGSTGFWGWIGIGGMDNPAVALTETWRPEEHWWWWRATRVVSTFAGGETLDYTIHEFPFFSFMLGDLHPHVMSLPFVALFLTLCWSFYASPIIELRPFRMRSYATVLVMGLALGGLAFTNMWDLPVFMALFVGVALLKAHSLRGGGLRNAVGGAAAVAGGVIVVALWSILPYLITFTSQVSGIGAVTGAATRPVHMFIVWGLLLVATVPLVLALFWRTTVRQDWAGVTFVSMSVGFLPFVVWAFLAMEKGSDPADLMGRLFHVLPLGLLVSIAVYGALWLSREKGSSPARVFALALSGLGLLLIMGPELLYVDDSFGPPSERMNTVFKLYYQGWVVLAAASGFALYYWSFYPKRRFSGRKLVASYGGTAVLIALLLGSAYYPLAAAATKGALFHEDTTLNGLEHVDRASRSEYRAIQFVRENAARNSTILEAVGGGYSPFGRISASTGVPTVLGWPGHESQWRGGNAAFAGREDDVAAVYQTPDPELAKTIMAKYGVDYVYVGHRELATYGTEGFDKFSEFMDPVFNEGGVTVYRLRR